MNKENNLYYLAGFFDGEGTILITRRYRKKLRGAKLYLSCRVVNTNKTVIDEFNKQWSGNLYEKKTEQDNHQQTYTWSRGALKAEEFLREIIPYIRQKKAEALVAIEFRERQKTLFNEMRHRPRKGQEIRNAYTEDDLKELLTYRTKLLSLRGAAINRRIRDEKA